MPLRSVGRKLSFDILTTSTSFEDDNNAFYYRSKSDIPILQNGGTPKSTKTNRRKRKNKWSKKKSLIDCSISEDSTELELDSKSYNSVVQTVVCEEVRVPEENSVTGTVSSVTGPEFFNGGELRQRSVVSGGGEEVGENAKEENSNGNIKELDSSVAAKQMPEMNGNVSRKLETEESLDWQRVMASDPNYNLPIEKSPVKIFIEEMYDGNSLRNTTTTANEKERERVYDTIFRLPWRCELLIDVGFFVCLDSFLSLVTIMPTRLLITFWRLLKSSSRGLQLQSCLILVVLLRLLVVSFSYNKQISA